MKVLRPISRWMTVLVLVVIFPPLPVRGGSPDTLLPDGVCGSPETMLKAAQAGNAMLQQAFSGGMLWGDKSLNEYINRLGQKLARSSGSQQILAFYVLYDPEVNAWSVPGGYIVINSGVISLAESEAELASVLSHEIAHENSCDWRTAPRKGNRYEIVALLPAVDSVGPAGIARTSGSGSAQTAVRTRFSWSEEERADRLAAQYLVRAGYDPHAAVQFFQRLQAEQERTGGELGSLLAAHPRTVDRQKNLEEIISNFPPRELAPPDDREFLRMRRAVSGYDEIYSRLVGVRLPGHDAPPPELSRRPPLSNWP